jgi:hypothetical protein
VAAWWDAVGALSAAERARLLQFATGSSRPPAGGFHALTSYDGRPQRFTLAPVPRALAAYPRAHTCFNRVDLPLYSTPAELRMRLRECLSLELAEAQFDLA